MPSLSLMMGAIPLALLSAETGGEDAAAALHMPELILALAALLFAASFTSSTLRRLALPFTVALVLIGLALREAAAALGISALGEIRLSPEIVIFVLVPILIFEAAFHIDARRFIENLGPILLLAVPSLLVSTAVVGWALATFGGIPLAIALVFGALISATDPVAVLAIFKEVGAPKRLSMLVDGESLLNDGTALVLFRILLAMALAGTLGPEAILPGTLEFLRVFIGGAIVGAALGWLCTVLLDRFDHDVDVEMTLTIVLAYASFAAADYLFHVSGVVSTLTAGILLGNAGRTKFAPRVLPRVEHFWEYLAFVANALIFLLVGLSVDLVGLGALGGLIAVAIAAVLVGRALGIFALLPLGNRFFGEPVSVTYQVVLFWGGLRGALALALALSIPPELGYRDELIGLTFVVVLFTLLLGGPTTGPLLRALGLMRDSREELAERRTGLALVEREVDSRISRAREDLPELARAHLIEEQHAARAALQTELAEMRRTGLLPIEEEERLVARFALLVERRAYQRLFDAGDLGEAALRDCLDRVQRETDARRWMSGDGDRRSTGRSAASVGRWAGGWIGRVAAATGIGRAELNRRRVAAMAIHFESLRARQIALREAEHALAAFVELEAHPTALASIRDRVTTQRHDVAHQIEAMAAEFPEYVARVDAMAERRFALHARRDAMEEFAEAGLLAERVVQERAAALEEELHELLALPIDELRIGPVEALRRVAYFAGLGDDTLRAIAARLRTRVYRDGETVMRQGEPGTSLFLVGRGSLAVTVREGDGGERAVTTLTSGQILGEMALLAHQPRTATVVTVTPAVLLELRESDLRGLLARFPVVQEAVEREFAARFVADALRLAGATRDLPGAVLERLARAFTRRRVAAGDVLHVAKGGPTDSDRRSDTLWIVVRSGTLVRSETAIGHLLGAGISEGDLVAASPTEYYALTRDDLHRAVATSPDLAAWAARLAIE